MEISEPGGEQPPLWRAPRFQLLRARNDPRIAFRQNFTAHSINAERHVRRVSRCNVPRARARNEN